MFSEKHNETTKVRSGYQQNEENFRDERQKNCKPYFQTV